MSNAAGRLRRLADLPERGTKELGDMDSVARLSAVVLMQWAEENWRSLARCLADEHEALEQVASEAHNLALFRAAFAGMQQHRSSKWRACPEEECLVRARILAATETALAALGEEGR